MNKALITSLFLSLLLSGPVLADKQVGEMTLSPEEGAQVYKKPG